MKKILAVFALLLIVAIAALPYWFGVQAEVIYHDQISYLRSANKLNVTEEWFRRGFLQSEARTSLNLGRGLKISAKHRIGHGPFPFNRLLHHLAGAMPIQAEIETDLTATFGSQASVALAGILNTIVGINGEAETTFTLPQQQIEMEPGGMLEFAGMSGKTTLDGSGTIWRGRGAAEGAIWRREAHEITFGPFDLIFDARIADNGLIFGSANIEASALEITDGGRDKSLSAQELTFRTDAKQAGATASYQISTTVNKLGWNGMQLGPGQWDIEFKNLDAAALAKLSTSGAEAALPLNELIEVVTRRRAVFDSVLSLDTSSGPLSANATLQIAPDKDVTQPLMALMALQGQALVSIPESMVKIIAESFVTGELQQLQANEGVPALTQTQHADILARAIPTRIQTWLDQNFLIKNKDNYEMHADYANGELLLNGRSFNPLALLQ